MSSKSTHKFRDETRLATGIYTFRHWNHFLGMYEDVHESQDAQAHKCLLFVTL
jgi:hypothetical protein